MAFAADGLIRLDRASLPPDLESSPLRSAVQRRLGDTGMRTCMVSAAYPRLWVRFRVGRMHPSRFLHVGLARAWPSSARRSKEAEHPLDRAGGYCFKLSDGCVYSPDGSQWSTDYADDWGFDEPVRTVGVFVDFPPSQHAPAGQEAARILRSLRARAGSGSVSGASGQSPAALAAHWAGAGMSEGEESTPTSVRGGASTSQVMAALSAAAASEAGGSDDGAGLILFSVNGRIVRRRALIRGGGSGRRDTTIRNLGEARARALEAKRSLTRSYKVGRNRLRGAKAGPLAPPSVTGPALPHAERMRPLSTIRESSGDEAPFAGGGNRPRVVSGDSAAIRPAAPAGLAAPPGSGTDRADGPGAAEAVTFTASGRWLGGGDSDSGLPTTPEPSPFAVTDVPLWYGAWRIAVSIGSRLDAVSLDAASASAPRELQDSLGLTS